nr:serine/threonine-protein kinase [Solirubrobacteraceae bacterium]
MTARPDAGPSCKFAVTGGSPARPGRRPSARRRRREGGQTADDTPATPDARRAPQAPTALGRYRLTRRLGAGAFGVVWLAHDERLDRIVAVKRIELHDEQVAARAEREALAAARLQHPGIVALYEAGRDEHAVYLVSELVRGRTLGDLVEDGALSDRDILRIGAALCDALAHAHARGVVHRDVKPANIIVPERPSGEAGLAKLTDFGVATMAGDDALTRTGDVVGTLAYMAPEQAEGLQVEGEADLYALALVLYEALSGVNPIRAGGAAATARRVGTRLPPLSRLRRDLPREACAALDRAVLPRPEDRGTLEDLRLALDDAVDGAARAPGPV